MIVEERSVATPPRWSPATPPPSILISIVIVALIVAGVVAGAVLRSVPVYESTATVLIDQPGLIYKASNEGVVVKLNQLRAKYAALARTQPLVEPVATRLSVPPGVVSRAISVVLPGPTLVLVVVARADRSLLARDIANGMAQQLTTYIAAEQDVSNIPESERIVLSTVGTARRGVKVEPTRGRAITLGSIGGILVLLGGVVMYQIVPRRRFKDR